MRHQLAIALLATMVALPLHAQQFCSSGPISIPVLGASNPYPSSIVVSGVVGTPAKVTVQLNGLSHTFPADVDMLVAGPAGQNVVIMSDAGGGFDVVNTNLNFDDAATASLTPTPIVSGTYKPTNLGSGDSFGPPAPALSGATTLATFAGANPNGSWSLFVVDDLGGDLGSLNSWCVTFAGSSVPPTPAAIPSLSAWGSAALSAALALFGVAWMRRRA